MARMQTLSIRLPDEDFNWLVSLPGGGAPTPSEKLRALLQQAREQQQGMRDPERCSAWMRQLVQPFVDEMGALEREQQRHSDLLAAVVEHAPAIMALLVAGRPAAEDGQGATSEALIAQRAFRLFAALLKGNITSQPATYASGAYDRHLPEIIELAQIISSRKGKETNHG
ncbi:MAG: hypothetical protein FWC58_02510 [Desulfobulbus sp.]|nr:hypothetical protein [Desulfobulbus sp.]